MKRRIARLSVHRRDIDRWAVIYLGASAFYPILRPDTFPDPYTNVLVHVGIALLVWFLPPLLRQRRGVWPRLAGEIYLPFLFPVFYGEMEYLGLIFFPFENSLDPALIRIEAALFGGQPSLDWSRAWPWPWFHELMEFAYFSYYLASFTAVYLILRARGVPDGYRWVALRSLIRDLAAVMLICYTLYTLFPVWGPKYFQTGPIAVTGGPFTAIMRHIHETGAILGAAFPSSHVAATLVPWYHVWKWFPRHRWWFTLLFLLLSASTVYCRYHYVVDVLGGAALGGIIVYLGERLGRGDAARSLRRRLQLPQRLRPGGGEDQPAA
ncbi:MAG: phosphatase PAP2 family protein [Candidatus Krumholzibacteriia bacterium]